MLLQLEETENVLLNKSSEFSVLHCSRFLLSVLLTESSPCKQGITGFRINNSYIGRSLSCAAAAEAGLSSVLGQDISTVFREEQKLEKKGKSRALIAT